VCAAKTLGGPGTIGQSQRRLLYVDVDADARAVGLCSRELRPRGAVGLEAPGHIVTESVGEGDVVWEAPPRGCDPSGLRCGLPL